MKTSRLNTLTHALASLAMAGSLATASLPALSDQGYGGSSTMMDDATRQEHMKERLSQRLDEMSKKLNITASQQAAWNEYSNAVQSTFDMKRQQPAADADAATIIRTRAKMAAEHADKMNKLADATEKLQGALTPEQRKTLNDIVRHPMMGKTPDERQSRHRGNEKPKSP